MNKPKNPFQPYERIGSTGGMPGGDPVRRRTPGPAIVLIGMAILGGLLIGMWWESDSKKAQASEKGMAEEAGDVCAIGGVGGFGDKHVVAQRDG